MITSYKTIRSSSEGIYREKGSKFIALAFQVQNVDQVIEQIDRVRKEYHDARHHCYAYILGTSGDAWKVSDDGEPAHSAGDPILNQVRSYELTNILVVVVRYFGGTKLGVSGLINAYKTATKYAIENNEVITVALKKYFRVKFDYESTSEIMKLLHDMGAKVEEQKFTESCLLRFSVPVAEGQDTADRLHKMEQMKIIQILTDQTSLS